MLRLLLFFCLIVFSVTIAHSQTITIQPYLQDASPSGIFILWETDSIDESIVEWGLTDTLGRLSNGTAFVSEGTNRVHQAELEGLKRFTKYYYRVKTGNAVSPIYAFKTPPFSLETEKFRLVAMSDMQRDGSHPDKFREIVADGILQYLQEEIEGEVTDNLALVMIPGDLVQDGNSFLQWKNHFFNPSEKLFSQIPVYPVLGNHENNSAYYFTYFKMPENGTAGFEEHWWFKDYGNVRIIGLNSNGSFAGNEQLDWLDQMLDETCNADSIEFVFAQLHHPHKSELWTPGESNFTGEVIQRLENFTSNCSKPSIHFFGHTHAYSRGQSRDHKHLWINVATAGGAIDNWGEFPNFDYDEFSVSQDEYGFVIVEVSKEENSKITIKRIGRGDQDTIVDNVLRDSFTIRLKPNLVEKPIAIGPLGPEYPECVTLKSSPFISENAAIGHGQSHWQVTTLDQGFNEPVFESWKNFENWYDEIDTQEGDDLTDEEVIGLEPFTTYYWRVRYRDKELNWSEWSEPERFTTKESIALPNLLVNPGAENDLNGWVIQEGVVEALTAGTCNGTSPHSGQKYFAVGGLCDHSPVGIATQDIDVTNMADSIDSGIFQANFGGYLSDYSGSDVPEIKLIYLNAIGDSISQSPILSTLNNSWTMLGETVIIPTSTRTIRFEMKGTRRAGTDNDSYFDDVFLKIGRPLDCTSLVSVRQNYQAYIPNLKISPNPFKERTIIQLPETCTECLVQMVDVNGTKVKASYHIVEDMLHLKRENLTAGNYFIWVKKGNRIIGKGKVQVVD